MPLITGNRAIKKAYVGTTELNAIMHAGVNLLDGTVLPRKGRTMLAKLMSSLILDEGTGGPTWSRDTKAWGFNELGYLEELASGCAFFGGARLVRNLVPTPSNTLAVAGTKTVTLTQAATLQFSMGAGAGTATFSGTGGATGTLAAGASRVSVNKTVTAGTFIVTASVAELVDLSIVDVTNYDASYVPEYVSVGVVSSPYHGAGIDGAKYFETDWQGAPIAAANLLKVRREASAINNLLFNRYFQGGAGTINQGWFIAQGSGADLVTNGEFATDTGWTKGVGWTISGGTAVATAVVNNQLTQNIGAVAGKTYTITFTLGAGWSGVLFCAIGGISSPISTTRANAAGTYSFHCIAGSSTPGILYFYPNSACTGTIDNVSVRESVIQVTQATGLDGIANTATTLTAAAADAIILQPISLASAARCASAYVKRKTGTGTISFTQDGGSTWTDITSQINSSTWSRVQITSTLANPSVGFKISTSGDAIDVDCVQNEAGAAATSPIVTTTAVVTRNAESLTFQTAGNIDFAVGTLFATALSNIASATRGVVYVGSSYFGPTSAVSTTLFRISDGTTILTKSGLSDISTGSRKRAGSWGGDGLKLTGDGLAPSVVAFDGSFGNGALINIGEGLNGYVGPVAIYNYQMTDAELQAITT